MKSVQYATKEDQRAITQSSKNNEGLGQSGNNAQLVMCLVVKVKYDAIKNINPQEPGMLGP